MGNRYEKALAYATDKHKMQVRKYTGEPYINHCLDVVSILDRHEYYSDVLRVVAILHDVVEDTDATFTEIWDRFGLDVMQGVFFLTDISRPEHGNRNVRKELDRLHILGTTCPFTLLIKCADIISNTGSIAQYDPDFAKIYIPEKKRLLGGMPRWVQQQSIFTEAAEIVGAA